MLGVQERVDLLITRGGNDNYRFWFCWKMAGKCPHVSEWHLWNQFSLRANIQNWWSKIQMVHTCQWLDEAYQVLDEQFSSLWHKSNYAIRWPWVLSLHLYRWEQCVYNRYPIKDQYIRVYWKLQSPIEKATPHAGENPHRQIVKQVHRVVSSNKSKFNCDRYSFHQLPED